MRDIILHHLAHEHGELTAQQIVADFVCLNANGIGECYTVTQVTRALGELLMAGKVARREDGAGTLWRFVPEVREAKAVQSKMF